MARVGLRRVQLLVKEEVTNKQFILEVTQVRCDWKIYSYSNLKDVSTYKLEEEWTKKLENYGTIDVTKDEILRRVQKLGLVENKDIVNNYRELKTVDVKNYDELAMISW